ncbi:MAG: GIY-YIG nuclease family protein [Calditrichaceae bacterium]
MKNHKELKEEYKNKKFKMGVFQIKNKINSKIFIGSSLNLDAIWNRHKTQLKIGMHPNKALQADWKQYGEDSFSYEILAELKEEPDKDVDTNKEVKLLEQLYIEELEPFGDRGYNKRPVNK